MTKPLRRNIFIGEAEGQAIYLDTKKDIPLKAEKGKLLGVVSKLKVVLYLAFVVLALVLNFKLALTDFQPGPLTAHTLNIA